MEVATYSEFPACTLWHKHPCILVAAASSCGYAVRLVLHCSPAQRGCGKQHLRFCLEMGWQVMDRAWPSCCGESPGSAKGRIASQLWHASTVRKMLVCWCHFPGPEQVSFLPLGTTVRAPQALLLFPLSWFSLFQCPSSHLLWLMLLLQWLKHLLSADP